MDTPDTDGTDLLFRRLLTRPGAIPKEWIMNPQFEELSNVFLRRAAVGADRVELWMGDGRKIQVLRRDLMGA